MNSSEQRLNCADVRSWDMIEYLSELGYTPDKIKGNNYWYLSPLRKERTASFKVNKKLNCWYDHGLGKGGNVIDFAILYYNCSVAQLLKNMASNSVLPKATFEPSAHNIEENKISILRDSSIISSALLDYLHSRRISYQVAIKYCREVRYQAGDKIYYAIGFKNDAGGYELRNPYFKNSSAPKGITTIKTGNLKVAVFEGFFDFLSFQVLHQNELSSKWDFCILNSVSFFEKAHSLLKQYNSIHLFLDNDATGQSCSRHALEIDKRYVDESSLYAGYKDLNEWLVNMGKQVKIGYNISPP